MNTGIEINELIYGIVDDYPVSLENLKNITSFCTFSSDVMKNGKMVQDLSIRNSFTYDKMKLDVDMNEIINILNVVPDIYCTKIIYDKVLVYTQNMFFSKHKDHNENNYHIGTLLIMPPKSLIDFKGGELVMYDEKESDKNPIKWIHDNNNWTMVYLNLGIYHSVEKILSGTRIAFKYKVFSDKLQLSDSSILYKINNIEYDSDEIEDSEFCKNEIGNWRDFDY
jgi:hypothetical protein